MQNTSIYKLYIAILLIGLIGATAAATYFYQQETLKVSQASDLNTQTNQLQGEISALNSQITSLNSQISSLNDHIYQLQTLNNHRGENTPQLTPKIQKKKSQEKQFKTQG